jgi:hypothetical protein
VERHVYLLTVFIIELALYKYPAKHAGLIHWGHIYRHIDVHAMIHQLKCSIGVKQQSLTRNENYSRQI